MKSFARGGSGVGGGTAAVLAGPGSGSGDCVAALILADDVPVVTNRQSGRTQQVKRCRETNSPLASERASVWRVDL